jgi:hypothetical protein
MAKLMNTFRDNQGYMPDGSSGNQQFRDTVAVFEKPIEKIINSAVVNPKGLPTGYSTAGNAGGNIER